MKTEKQKMIAGENYDTANKELVEERIKTRLLLKKFNESPEDETEERKKLTYKLLPNAGVGLVVQPPFYCDYGWNTKLGEKVFFNFNCVVLDVAPVIIGDRTLFGPNVQIYTAAHPMSAEDRAAHIEFARPISIGSDVWVGGSAVICPGVSIGDRTVIGAGSVVTKNIPSDVFAAGNPCRVIRKLSD